MRLGGLLVVLIFARVLSLAGKDLSFSLWFPLSFLWQDALVLCAFSILELCVKQTKIKWILYAVLVFILAVNVPLIRILSTPLTWPIIRAAGGALSDSLWVYVNLQNFLFFIGVLLAGTFSPFILRRKRMRPVPVALLSAIVAALGPYATLQMATHGWHRNPIVTLFTTLRPRLEAKESREFSRESLSHEKLANSDLSEFRATASGRNVILVALESAAAIYLRPYGANQDPMPFLTELAAQGILFKNAYTVYPESIKGFLSVICSLYPAIDVRAEDYEAVRCPALGTVLSQNGYKTSLFHSGRFGYLGMDSIIRNRGFGSLQDAGDITGAKFSSFGVNDERITVRSILRWIDGVGQEKPFFVTYLPIAGHHPYSSPEPGPFPGKGEQDDYFNALHHADSALRELWEGLKHRNLLEKTLFVFYGDHGQAFGQHPGNFAHTLFIFEENVRVPLHFVAPGRWKRSTQVQNLASQVDIAPTLLDLLGLPIPSEYRGDSLLDSRNRMALFFTDYSMALLGLRDEVWKYIYELETGRMQLFNLNKDPQEKSNLAKIHQVKSEKYRDTLVQWSASELHQFTKKLGNLSVWKVDTFE